MTDLLNTQQVPKHLCCPPRWDTSLLYIFHDSSFIFLAALDWAHTAWLVPPPCFCKKWASTLLSVRPSLHLVFSHAKLSSSNQEFKMLSESKTQLVTVTWLTLTDTLRWLLLTKTFHVVILWIKILFLMYYWQTPWSSALPVNLY